MKALGEGSNDVCRAIGRLGRTKGEGPGSGADCLSLASPSARPSFARHAGGPNSAICASVRGDPFYRDALPGSAPC